MTILSPERLRGKALVSDLSPETKDLGQCYVASEAERKDLGKWCYSVA